VTDIPDEKARIANALLMISDLEGGGYGYMDHRWNQSPGRPFFESLPDRFRHPLMAGFGLLRERWVDWRSMVKQE